MPIPASICQECRSLLRAALRDSIENETEEYWDSYRRHPRTIDDLNLNASLGCPVCKWLAISIDDLPEPDQGGPRDHVLVNCSVSFVTGRYMSPHSAVYSNDHTNGEESECWVKFVLDCPLSRKLRGRDRTYVDLVFQPNDGETHIEEAELDPSTGSARSFLLARKWLNKCSTDHTTCRSQRQPGWMPTRLVQIVTMPDGTYSARLRETAIEPLESTTEYLALSHRWCANDTCHLTVDSLPHFRKNIPINASKKSVQDAMTTTVQLGYAFLWVDTLCIIQDDEEDKAREIMQMHRIYGSSICTIAASWATTVDEGCFTDREPSTASTYSVDFEFEKGIQPKSHLLRRSWIGSGSSAHARSALTYRGWCFQERVLSPRNLFFSKKQIHWECFELEASETYPEGALISDLPPTAPSHALFHQTRTMNVDGIWRSWSNLVQAFTSCSLTVRTDRLMGMAGIAAMCKTLYNEDDHLWGHWRMTLPESLLWSTEPTRELDERGPERLMSIAPSWSWASATGKAILPTRGLSQADRLLVELISAPAGHNMIHEDGDIPSLGARGICLKGQVWQDTILHCGDERRRDRLKKRFREVVLRRFPYPHVDWYTFGDHKCDPYHWPQDDQDNTIRLDIAEGVPLNVTCMPVVESSGGISLELTKGRFYEQGLILVRRSKQSDSTYKRIGIYAVHVSQLPKCRKLTPPVEVCIC